MEKLLEIEEAEDAVQTAEAPAAAKKTTPAQHTVKPESSLSSEGTKGTGASNTEGNSKKEGSGSIKAKSQTNGEHYIRMHIRKMYSFSLCNFLKTIKRLRRQELYVLFSTKVHEHA